MFLTCIEIDASKVNAAKLLSSPYRVHAAIEGSFSTSATRMDETGRILWRLDGVPSSDSVRLYIASPEQPHTQELLEQLEIDDMNACISKDYEPLLCRLQNGDNLRFRLKANPVRKVSQDLGRRARPDVVGSIQGHVTVKQQTDWLLKRAEGAGFKVVQKDGDDCLIVSHRYRERFAHGKGTVTLSTARYDGVLEIIDNERFQKTLRFGLGKARGFGCGLLTVVPCK